ncbi:hypothetical protein OG979_17490 [Actinomadura citrea]|uniref:hypothetical protein n=1 Tax=Actinomadura citrea TaxID=46158 RepID=UPI002E2A06B6|nr:hypothetical protein [Actinomadura citrea]
MALVTYEQLAAYPGFEGKTEADVSALIDGASALVSLVAQPADLDAATLPPAIVPVLVAMIRRGLSNPLGRSGEQMGDYGWQAAGGGESLYATPREERIIRRAVGQLSAGTVTLEADTPLPPWYGGTDDILGSL